jgi:hypothetical protein
MDSRSPKTNAVEKKFLNEDETKFWCSLDGHRYENQPHIGRHEPRKEGENGGGTGWKARMRGVNNSHAAAGCKEQYAIG